MISLNLSLRLYIQPKIKTNNKITILKCRVFPIIILLRIIACKFQYFPSIFLYFNQYQVKLFIDRLCMFPELNDLLHKQQNFSIFITDVKVTFHLKIYVNWKPTVIGQSFKICLLSVS